MLPKKDDAFPWFTSLATASTVDTPSFDRRRGPARNPFSPPVPSAHEHQTNRFGKMYVSSESKLCVRP